MSSGSDRLNALWSRPSFVNDLRLRAIGEHSYRTRLRSRRPRSVELVLDGPVGRGLAVRGDSARLHVVLANLLANAMKYTPSGGTIALRVKDAPDQVRVTVEDSGPGVPPEFRERIFEKFFRVEHHREGDAGVRGSGIGLYIAREVIEAHGGTLRCEEREGGGARLVLVLPR